MNLQALLSEELPPSRNAHQPDASNQLFKNIPAGAVVTPSHSPPADSKEVRFAFCSPTYEPISQQQPQNPTMKIAIHPHDTTESITSTVKSYFGLPSGDSAATGSCRVSFEDSHGNCMIISYDNVSNGMTVFVRVLSGEPTPKSLSDDQSHSSEKFPYPSEFSDDRYNGHQEHRSTSPTSSKGGRSAGAGALSMTRTKSNKRHDSTTPAPDAANADPKVKPEPVASAEISLDNILEGSRRKRPKFESSELPLFPENTIRFNASSSSASPSRPTPQPTPYSQQFHPQMRQNYPQSAYLYSLGNDATPPQVASVPSRVALPTPAPTIASCISDEDVAIQLMRLGEAPQFLQQTTELHFSKEENGQTLPNMATRVVSDTSRNADNKHLISPISHGREKKQKLSHELAASGDMTEPSDDEDDSDDLRDTSYVGANTDHYEDEDDDDKPLISKRPVLAPKRRAPAPPGIAGTKKKASLQQNVSKGMGAPRKPPQKSKTNKQANNLINKQLHAGMNALADATAFEAAQAGDPTALSIAPLTGLSALSSVATFSAQQMQEPVEHLKPRCQRCRKSKKGCDRQRPCQRCKDAGIPAEQCISEDETGTRRGRANASKANAGVLKAKNALKIKKKKLLQE